MKNLSSCQLNHLSMVLLAICAGTSIGCQSMGKFNLMADKQIPVLTRDADLDLPPPSAAETPSPAVVATSGISTVPSNLASTNAPTTSAVTTMEGQYPATSYGTFPQQPEALQEPAKVATNAFPTPTAPSSTVANTNPSNFDSSATNHLTQNVQQGPYATKATPPQAASRSSAITAFPTSPTTSAPTAGTVATNQDDFPVAANAMTATPQEITHPTQQASANSSPWPTSSSPSTGNLLAAPTTSPAPATVSATGVPNSNRDSSFGGPPAVTTTSTELASATTESSGTELTGVSPPASQIPAYVEGHQNVSATSYGADTGSHYEQVATQPVASGGWRPGSTARR